MQSTRAEIYQGPLPPPEILKGYNDIVPNGAERILAVFERQAAHRMEMELIEVAAENGLAIRGLNRATLVCSFAFIVAGLLAYTGQGAAAVGLAGGGLAAIAGAFIYGTRKREGGQRSSPRSSDRPLSEQSTE